MYRLPCAFVTAFITRQQRSQKAENDTHIKGRLLDQAVILINCVSFQNGNFSLRKEFTRRGSEFFPLRAVPNNMENHVDNIW